MMRSNKERSEIKLGDIIKVYYDSHDMSVYFEVLDVITSDNSVPVFRCVILFIENKPVMDSMWNSVDIGGRYMLTFQSVRFDILGHNE